MAKASRENSVGRPSFPGATQLQASNLLLRQAIVQAINALDEEDEAEGRSEFGDKARKILAEVIEQKEGQVRGQATPSLWRKLLDEGWSTIASAPRNGTQIELHRAARTNVKHFIGRGCWNVRAFYMHRVTQARSNAAHSEDWLPQARWEITTGVNTYILEDKDVIAWRPIQGGKA